MSHNWKGFRFPTRLITDEERELLSPTCERCMAPALVVVLQRPLNDTDNETSLLDYEDTEVLCYCGFHTTEDVPDELLLVSEADFERRVFRKVLCPKQMFSRQASNCIIMMECARSCTVIKPMLDSMHLGMAKEVTQRIHDRRLKEKGLVSWRSPGYPEVMAKRQQRLLEQEREDGDDDDEG